MNKTRLLTLFFTPAICLCVSTTLMAQRPMSSQDAAALKIYRATATKVNDLIHTKLDVRFDYKKHYLYGKEWVTIKPHIYPTDSLRLDAKGMDIKTIAMVKGTKLVPLKFSYDSLTLAITLDKKYLATENYTVFIDYTSKPDELKAKGSAAITGAKGLYFINADGAVKDKPIQIWTQGETESSSCWFPTIDRTNQKTTDEISMTVPAKYVTLSNGRLASQKPNADGTRTDTWKMELPHSPYLFMMAVGDFKIYKDKWRNKEVNYYLEPKYAPYAKELFGFTPEVMEFYSQKLGVAYPWNKYSQIVVRDYVSGAMENTTATLHGSQVQATHRELIDGKIESEIDIVHELFHQWFGDYVTAESWSNITVNESFANFSETLWFEHKHGKDAGDEQNYLAMLKYMDRPRNATKNLVRFNYVDKEEVFDAVSYEKGGRILNMLRNYLGEDAFFKGLRIYLTQNAFKNGEAQQLRLAFEEASGKDLNWYFNQWYYAPGHPELKIDYKWDQAAKIETVYLTQTQKGDNFILPMAIDIYAGGKKERHNIWMRNKADTLTFKVASAPDLVNVDGDKILLARKTDSKTFDQLVFQYFNAPLYLDRFEAIDAAAKQQDNKAAQKLLLAALKDKYYNLRIKAIKTFDLSSADVRAAAVPILLDIAKNDEKTLVRAAALNSLAKLNDAGYLPLFKQTINSQSYAIQAASLNGIAGLAPADALKIAKNLEHDTSGPLTDAITKIYGTSGGDAELAFMSNAFKNAPAQAKFGMLSGYIKLLSRVNDTQAFKASIDDIKVVGKRFKQFGSTGMITKQLDDLKNQKEAAKQTEQAQYTASAIDELK